MLMKSPTPRGIVAELVKNSPGTSREVLFEEFRKSVAIEATFRRAVEWFYFVNMYDEIRAADRKGQRPSVVSRERVESLKRKITEVVFMDLTLPSGKKLKDSTFAECGKAGGWFTRVSLLGNPADIVGAKITEHELKAVAYSTANKSSS